MIRIPIPRIAAQIKGALGGGDAGRLLRFRAKVRVRTRMRPLRIRISEFQIKWLTDKAKFVRVAMRSLLSKKRQGRKSRPGEPPTKRIGFIYKMTLYAVDRREVLAVVGPLLKKANKQRICGILDRGGVARIRAPQNRKIKGRDPTGKHKTVWARYKPRPFSRPGLLKGLKEYDDKRMRGKL